MVAHVDDMIMVGKIAKDIEQLFRSLKCGTTMDIGTGQPQSIKSVVELKTFYFTDDSDVKKSIGTEM